LEDGIDDVLSHPGVDGAVWWFGVGGGSLFYFFFSELMCLCCNKEQLYALVDADAGILIYSFF
jgi:hypothetical protein